MKPILAILLLGVLTPFCYSQSPSTLLFQKRLSDLSSTPIYKHLVDTVEGEINYKPSYQYLNDLEISVIAYNSDGHRVNGFMVRPKTEGTYPCIIFNRGGNRNSGVLKIATAAIRMGEIAQHGYTVIASQYRGNAGSEGKEEFGGKDINDVLNLIDVLSDVEGADTSKIGMYGWSRGGMMTYIALTKTKKIKAAVIGGAPTNLFDQIEERPKMESKVFSELIPNYASNKKQELEKRSAQFWTNQLPKTTPILLLHGNSDWRVKSDQSLKMALKLEKHRIPYKLVIYEGGDHGITEHRKLVNAQVVRWFNTYLKAGNELPNMNYHGR